LAYRYLFTLTKAADDTPVDTRDNTNVFENYQNSSRIVGENVSVDSANPLVLHCSIDFDSEGSSVSYVNALTDALGVGQVFDAGITMSNVSGSEV
tara:strand:- start:3107 stop:3391 length:285 start_codon:yes stop_codon:yes gene_type:complete